MKQLLSILLLLACIESMGQDTTKRGYLMPTATISGSMLTGTISSTQWVLMGQGNFLPQTKTDTVPCIIMVSDTAIQKSIISLRISCKEAGCSLKQDTLLHHAHSKPTYYYPDEQIFSIRGYIVRELEYTNIGSPVSNGMVLAINSLGWVVTKTLSHLNKDKQPLSNTLCVWQWIITKN